MDLTSDLKVKVIEDIKKALEHDIDKAASIIKKHLKDINNIPLNIAVTGESGSGKSSFVNAFRGIDDTDEKAAPTGVETTMKPELYPHPKYQNVVLWDLPGMGTTKFPADEYVKKFHFEKFSFFIIVSADRFTENDVKLAKKIKEMEKKLYFVRPKIDHNLQDEERSKKEKYDEEKTLQKIRDYCIQGLEEQGVASPQVFLVSNCHPNLYDFPTLLETMEREVPSHQRDVLILALPNVCKSIIHKKIKVLRSEIKFAALASAIGAGVPIPGVDIAADVGILVTALTRYLLVLDLDIKPLGKIFSDKAINVLKACIEKSSAGTLSSGSFLVKELLSLVLPESGKSASKEFLKYILLLGIPFAVQLSFRSIYTFLNSVLDQLSDQAQKALIEALGIK